jgi:hypothetical protein
MRLEEIEHARFRALSQLIVDQEKGVEAFEEYMKVAFPYLDAVKKKDRQQHINILKEWTKRGPMKVTPLGQPKLRSRMKQRTTSEEDRRRAATKAGGLSKKLGRIVPTWDK